MVRLVTDYLDEAVKKYPDKPAFIDDRRSLSFAGLQREAMQIGATLADRHWFKRPVAVFFDKSVECIAASLGVVYSGNFYSPLDTKMPEKRIAKILEVLRPAAIITDRVHASQAAGFAGAVSVFVYEDMLQGRLRLDELSAGMNHRIDSDIVSILFTSGSTGVPKGVVASHRFLVNYVEWYVDAFSLNALDTRGSQAPLYFAISAYTDVYGTLRTGCTTYLLSPERLIFPAQLMAFLAEKEINTIFWVPSLLCSVANFSGLQVQSLPALRHVFFCGEPLPVKQLNMWRKAFPMADFTNLYGSTELAIVAYYQVDRDLPETAALPMGRACCNTDVFLLDAHNQLVTGNQVGEVCIRGTLTSGYYDDPERTAAAYVQNPLNLYYPEMIFRTGDLARYNENGELVYVSRKDSQVKHMGYRIELGEIETGIASIAGVTANCCLYDKAHEEIVLFYAGNIDEKALMTAAADILPRYMWPSRLVWLENLPRTLSGKVDRMELKEQV